MTGQWSDGRSSGKGWTYRLVGHHYGRHGGALLQVRPHVAALAEAQPALVTRVWFNACVIVHVHLQVVFFGERLATHSARVRLDA